MCVDIASTRALYEKKLHRMMTQHSQHSVNNKDDAVKYSDSEEEDGEEEEFGMGYHYISPHFVLTSFLLLTCPSCYYGVPIKNRTQYKQTLVYMFLFCFFLCRTRSV